MLPDVEGLGQFQLGEFFVARCRPDQQQPALRVLGQSVDEDQQALKNVVVEPRANVDELDQSFEVIEDDTGVSRFVGVFEDLNHGVYLAVGSVAHEVLGRDELHERERALAGEVCGDRGLPCARLAFEDDRVELTRGSSLGDLDGVAKSVSDLLESAAVVVDLSSQEGVKLLLVHSELGPDLPQSLLKVFHLDLNVVVDHHLFGEIHHCGLAGHREGGSTFDDTFNLSPGVVVGHP